MPTARPQCRTFQEKGTSYRHFASAFRPLPAPERGERHAPRRRFAENKQVPLQRLTVWPGVGEALAAGCGVLARASSAQGSCLRRCQCLGCKLIIVFVLRCGAVLRVYRSRAEVAAPPGSRLPAGKWPAPPGPRQRLPGAMRLKPLYAPATVLYRATYVAHNLLLSADNGIAKLLTGEA